MGQGYISLGASYVGNPDVNDTLFVRPDGFVTLMDQATVDGASDQTVTLSMTDFAKAYPTLADTAARSRPAPAAARVSTGSNRDDEGGCLEPAYTPSDTVDGGDNQDGQ